MILPKLSHPVFDTKIPSTGQDIKIKQMLAKDEKILLMAKADSGTAEEQQIAVLKAIKQVINNSIVTPGVNVDKLAYFDIEYLFIKLREFSVSNKVASDYEDYEEIQDWVERLSKEGQSPESGPPYKVPRPEPHKLEVDLSKVEIKWPEDRNNVIKIDNAISVEMKYPDASLYTNDVFLKSVGSDAFDFLIKNSIKQIKEGDKVYKAEETTANELSEFLDQLPIASYDKIREFLTNLPHVFYEIKYTNKLGNERTITLTKLSDFFSF